MVNSGSSEDNSVPEWKHYKMLKRKKKISLSLPLRFNANSTSEELEKLASLYKNDETMLVRIAKHPNLNVNTMCFLATQNKKICEALLFSHFNAIPSEVQETIINRKNDKPKLYAVLLGMLINCSQNLDKKLLWRLLETNYSEVSSSLPLKTFTPPEILTALAKTDNVLTRANVAANETTPMETIRVLLDDDSVEVRLQLAQRKELKEKDLEKLIRKDEEQGTTDADSSSAWGILNNPNVTGRVLELIVEVYGIWFETEVFAHSLCPPRLQVGLRYGSKSRSVRKTELSDFQKQYWKQWVVDYLEPYYPEVHMGLPLEWLEELVKETIPNRV